MSRLRGGPCTNQVLPAAIALVLLLPVTFAAAAQPGADTAKARIKECVTRAARHHRVNPVVLEAILRVESNLNPRAVGRNADGSLDIGIAQINSQHFGALAVHGIRPGHLLDACVGTFVAAWHLSRLIAAHGNSWTTIARYHSGTPYLNHRYQVLLANELVRAGVIAGPTRPVPALPQRVAAKAAARSAESGPPALVLDGIPGHSSP